MRVLVVDGANVVGSRPDGWWRDRPGAARRLHDRLVRLLDGGLPVDEVRLVLEGAARRGPAVGVEGRLRTVHAAGEGDDTIVAEVRALGESGCVVTVVTADRDLRARVRALGAEVEGPSWLLDRL
jgi:hypothetical protein